MVPKRGELQQTKNWRPIAAVEIPYISKMLHDRFHDCNQPDALVLTTRQLHFYLLQKSTGQGL